MRLEIDYSFAKVLFGEAIKRPGSLASENDILRIAPYWCTYRDVLRIFSKRPNAYTNLSATDTKFVADLSLEVSALGGISLATSIRRIRTLIEYGLIPVNEQCYQQRQPRKDEITN